MNICKVDGCKNIVYSRGFCKPHYMRWWKHGDPLGGKTLERHKMNSTLEYSTWSSMKTRCTNSNNKSYHRYGGRGIKICDRWLHSFINFYKDMGPKPFPKAQIDRIDNNGNYEPNNCRWVTLKENTRNRNNTKFCISYAYKLRDLYKSGIFTQRDLASIYSTNQRFVWLVLHRKLWN